MYIIFEKRTNRVRSVFEGNTLSNSEDLLRSMFPNDFKDVALWNVREHISHNPVYLKVSLDGDGNPEKLLFNGKPIYVVGEEEKQENEEKKLKEKKSKIEVKLSKRFLKSISFDVMRMWSRSQYTDPSILPSIQNLDYFQEELLPVQWWGPFTDAGGYANMNREIVFRLHNHHIIPKVDICPTAPQVSQMAQYYLSKYKSFDLSRIRKYPKVWAFTPLPHPPNKGKNIIFTMMETETLHPEFVHLCNLYAEEVWVPSKHNKRVFSSSGVTKDIKVFPLGIDEILYGKVDPDRNTLGNIEQPPNVFVNLLGQPVKKGIKKFRFLTLFGWSYRKGPDILIKSFVENFTDKDDVCLIVVSRHSGSPEQSHIDVIKSEVDKYAKSVRGGKFPQIILYPHVIPEAMMPEIFKMGHCFIHTSRGEGFSLPQIEASACGLPVISCNNTGMSEYLTDQNSYIIRNEKTEVCNPEMHWITPYYHGQLFPKLGRAEIDQAKKHMTTVMTDYDGAIEKAKRLRKLVFQKYTWGHEADRIARRIREIYRNY